MLKSSCYRALFADDRDWKKNETVQIPLFSKFAECNVFLAEIPTSTWNIVIT